MKAYLKRQNDNGNATYGVFFFETIEGVKTLASLELPWLNNEVEISCIPKGNYKVVTNFSSKYQKDMWQVLDVEGRTGIRIHSANYASEIEGCIVLGSERKDINGDGTMDVAGSRKAIKLAKYHLGKEFNLEIL